MGKGKDFVARREGGAVVWYGVTCDDCGGVMGNPYMVFEEEGEIICFKCATKRRIKR